MSMNKIGSKRIMIFIANFVICFFKYRALNRSERKTNLRFTGGKGKSNVSITSE
ncbi:hypothetical protein GCM10007932_35890 [Vibrio penaeicida]|uniref:Uncharacterized protein n=1 Tax=Vibrio penaeicida TaxID=104609 RepID=A0AAV5NVH7_9VIBR|nr:hypothetical protein GCM10007932_35890 [Vibrio penaeicida]